MRLAIIGSTQFADDEDSAATARSMIDLAIEFLEPELIISGGAIGIDTFAREAAEAHSIEVQEFLPTTARWRDGYKPRNLEIIRACTHLLCIRHSSSRTYGSGWTADRAEEFGVRVYRRTI